MFRSEDGGETWKLLDAGLTNGVLLALQFDAAGNLWAGAALPPLGFAMRLNIDQPALEFSTLLGGSGGASPLLTLARNDGRIVILGGTVSSDFPVTIEDQLGGNPYNQTFMTILDSSGRLESSRRLGNRGAALALDPLGRLHVVGSGTVMDAFGSDVRVNDRFPRRVNRWTVEDYRSRFRETDSGNLDRRVGRRQPHRDRGRKRWQGAARRHDKFSRFPYILGRAAIRTRRSDRFVSRYHTIAPSVELT